MFKVAQAQEQAQRQRSQPSLLVPEVARDLSSTRFVALLREMRRECEAIRPHHTQQGAVAFAMHTGRAVRARSAHLQHQGFPKGSHTGVLGLKYML